MDPPAARPSSDHAASESGIVDVGGWVAPAMELVYEQGTPAFRGQWPRIESMLELAAPRRGRGDWVHPPLELPAGPSRRAYDDAWHTDDTQPPVPPVLPGVLHDNAVGRVAALDAAGVAMQLINPGPSIDACLQLPSDLAAGVFGAYNRYVTTYCQDHPRRLGAVLQLHGGEPRWSAHEVSEFRDEWSVRAVSICLPARVSPEDGQFDVLWESLEHAGLPLLHRSSMCAPIWSPGRLLAYLRRAGVLERYPQLRVGFAGHSERSGVGLARSIRSAAMHAALGSRIFAAVSSPQLKSEPHDTTAMLWASDFPLRGSLRSELDSARQALGPRAQAVLVTAPSRFLGA